MNRQTLQAKESAPAKKSSFSWLRPAAAHPAAEAEHEAPSASSPSFAHDFTKVPVRPMRLPGVPGFSCPFAPQRCPSGGACHTCPPKMQAKLKIGQPGDRYEQEADRVAETVMRMPEPQVQRKCSAPGCKDEEEKKLLQTKPANAGEAVAQVDHPLIQSVLSSPGQPLDAGTRSFMEPRFGQDFSGVRVHVGGEAAEAARAVNARAYTVGRNVVFGDGQYAPGSDEGKRLVAHELAHVGQQGEAGLGHMIQRELIYGSAYKRPYTNDPTETRDSEAGKWFPSSVDMAATATNSGGGTGSGKFADLLQALAAKSAGSIKELGLIGHANSSAFALGGTIKPGDNVYFAADSVIDDSTLTANAATIAGVKDRFAAGTKIILYGCHAGVGQALLDDISQAFGVCVEGFKNEITWCIIWDGATRKITSRGRVYVIDINDPLQIRPSCDQFYTDVKSLKPDGKSCKGVPAAKSAPPPGQKATSAQDAEAD